MVTVGGTGLDIALYMKRLRGSWQRLTHGAWQFRRPIDPSLRFETVGSEPVERTFFARQQNETRRGKLMAFNNDDFHAPEGMRTDEFLLRPIRAIDAQLDYEAVMESKEFLRRWEQSGWPTDDFTVEANREDMEKLERRHATGETFTYTVLNTTGTQCFGCVYILPTTARWLSKAQITAIDGAQWSAYEAAVLFWVRQSRLAEGLDRRLLDAIGPWLAHDWRIANHLIVTNEQFEQQVALIEGADLEIRFRLGYPNQPGNYLAYANDASGAQRIPPPMG